MLPYLPYHSFYVWGIMVLFARFNSLQDLDK